MYLYWADNWETPKKEELEDEQNRRITKALEGQRCPTENKQWIREHCDEKKTEKDMVLLRRQKIGRINSSRIGQQHICG